MAKKIHKAPAKNNPALDTEPLVKAGAVEDDDMEGDDEGDDDEGDDEDEDDGDGMGKSAVDADDLLKSLSVLEMTAEIAKNGGSMRRAELAQKVASGTTLSKSEKGEMRRLLDEENDTDDDGEPSLSKSHREEWSQDPAIGAGFEASTFLDAQASAICKSLDGIRQLVARSDGETKALVGKLAEGTAAVGRIAVEAVKRVGQLEALVKSMGEEIIAQPAQPKAQTRVSRVGQPFNGGQPAAQTDLQKSQAAAQRVQAGQPPISKEQIGRTINDLVKSTEPAAMKGEGHFGMVEGVDFKHEATLWETTKQISPSAMRIVLRKNGIEPSTLGL